MSSTNREVLEALRSSFPQLFTRREEDGQLVERIDLEQIRLLAGEGNYSDKYGLRWENKPERFDAESVGKLPSLKHVAGRSIHSDPAKPTHVLIEGDNYHALKVLAYTHERSVDVIYIDPPYNTGNKDFKYNDRFVDKEDGYRHSKWLSFMAKRLKLARTLLSPSGVVLVSIDENERANLELLGRELFPRYLGEFIWDKRSQKGGAAAISTSHEHVLAFANESFGAFNEVEKPNALSMQATAARIVRNAKREGKGILEAEIVFRSWLEATSVPPAEAAYCRIEVAAGGRVRLFQGTSLAWPQSNNNGYRYEILHPVTGLPCALPPMGLRFVQTTFQRLHDDGEIIYGEDHTTQPRRKLYLDENTTEKVRSIIVHSKGGVTDLRELGGLDALFPYPKPLGLLIHLLKVATRPDSVVLDFFAGSGTTAHAVMQLNAEDGGHRQCILVTNDEGEFKDDAGEVLPGGICTHVTYPRLKKVIEGYSTPKGKDVAGLGENLEFFQTSFQPIPKSRNQLRAFLRHSSALLQLKTGCFDAVETTPEWSIHASSNRHLFILFDDCACEAALERLRAIEGPIEAYVFAYDVDDDSAEVLRRHPNVTVQEVPKPLLDLFFRIKE